MAERGIRTLSLLKISSEPGILAAARIASELMLSNETGWDLKHERLTSDRDGKTLRYIDLQTTAYRPPRYDW
jgi:hypothetical protein